MISHISEKGIENLTSRIILVTRFFKPQLSLVFQFVNFLPYSFEIVLSFVRKLLISKCISFLALSKPCKQESENWILKESFLWFFTIFVHCVPNQGKIYILLVNERVFLVVSVRVNNQHEKVNEVLLLVVIELIQNCLEMFKSVCLH